MLRFTLLSLVIVIVAIIFFHSSISTVKTQHIDSVSQAEQLMSH